VSSLFAETRALLEREGLAPRKRLGQHFLVDGGVVERMVALADVGGADTVLEIGPGVGALTDVLAARAGRLYLIEYDRGLCSVLRRKFAASSNVHVVEGDALRLDLCAAVPEAAAKVVASLPYNVAVAILFRLIDARHVFSDLTVMVQREVAERLTAAAGSRIYGAPSVLFQLYARLLGRFRVGSSAFYPRPQVASEVVRVALAPEPRVAVDDPALLVALVRAAFGQRRKMLHNALLGVPERVLPAATWGEALRVTGIDGRRRGETLDLDAFVALANAAARLREAGAEAAPEPPRRSRARPAPSPRRQRSTRTG
jgi:16S rRNA (adenine1518-N6/adenine1519-N6)-dimethyltransferase